MLGTTAAAVVAAAVLLPSTGATGSDGPGPDGAASSGVSTDRLPSDTTTIPSDPVTPSRPAAPQRSKPRAALPSDDDTPVGPLKLMITGDSISHEFAGDYTWRWRLWNEFKRQQTDVDFVGPRTGSTGAIPLPLVPWADDQHDALGGTRLSWEVPNIGEQVRTYQPDVMLLMMGFNDLNHGAPMPDVVANMETYLNNVWAAKPDTRVVLHRILNTVVYPTTNPRTIDIAGTNAGFIALVNKFRSEGRPITLASGYAGWVPRRHTVDGVHPTPTGETVIAQHYAYTLHALGVLPQAPSLAKSYVPWVANPRATVTQRPGRVIRFTWEYYRVRLTMYQGMLRITGGTLKNPLITRGYTFTSQKDVRLARGRYTVQLAPIRKWLVGYWGPKVAFTVR